MPPKRKLRRLRKLKLGRVDLVPAGANPGARIELYKREKEDELQDEKPDLATEIADLRVAVEKLKRSMDEQRTPAPAQEESLAKRRERWIAEREAEDAERSEQGQRPDKVAMFFAKKRRELGVSQEDVAKSAGLTQPTISEIENGRRPSLDTFSALYEALGCSIDELRDAGIFRG